MRTGTVIVTDLSGNANKIFHSGDPVTERNFPAGNFEKLVNGGYIKEDVAEVKAEVKKDPPVEVKSETQDSDSEKENKPEAPEGNKKNKRR